MLKKIRILGLILLTAFFITACGSAQPVEENPGEVQDLKPGDRSMIQDPAPARDASRLEERSI